MNTNKAPSLYEVSFMNVTRENINVEIREFDKFANITIDLGAGEISLFTEDLDEAIAIVNALSRIRIQDCKSSDSDD